VDLAIDLEMLEIAFTDYSPEATWVLDTATGDVIRIWDDDPEPELTAEQAESDARYLVIEPQESSQGFRDMRDFAAAVTSQRLREALDLALNGQHPFRRFKEALLGHTEDRERWFAFEKKRLELRLRTWLEAHGISARGRV
jgi:hypothetical protein